MPIYEYECTGCEKVFEVQQRIADDPIDTCPKCHGQVKKLISASSFQLKGGGWYSDGYSSSSASTGTNGASSDKKETSSPPPCQSAGGSCKGCPAAV